MGTGTQQVDANPATVNTYDEADQLKTIGGVTNGYDLNANLLTIGIGGSLPNTFLYDQENRLFRTGPCRADVNGDGLVNSTDQLVIGKHTGNQGSTPFDLNTDLNEDLSVNSTDALFASMESGKNCKGASGNGRSWYDGDGLRVRQRTFMPAGAPFDVNDDYVWDTGAGLPVVLQDARRLGTNPSTTTTYLYGLGLISETSGAGVTSYYLADGLGSTTQLTDSAGAITDSYSYDVFGAPRTVTGTTANNFQYTGQQRDGNANRGLYYLRARSYDPALGRFLQKDPLPLVNGYPYAANNAANLADPNGLFPCPGCGKIRHAASTAVDDVASVITDGKLGYVDLNLTACYGVCVTGGVQWQVGTTEWHTYVGGGVGSPGGSLTATFAPFQTITTGWNCGAQFTGGGYSYQFGRPVKDKEGSLPLFIEGGRGFGNGISVTCFYVF